MAVAREDEIIAFLRSRAVDSHFFFGDQKEAATLFSCSMRDVEEVGLEHSLLPERYQRNGLSCVDQLKLFRSRIAVIGCGGLGGRTSELLTRAGVGTLSLTDPDTFCESNLNRQTFCTAETLGLHKAEVVARELQKINPTLATHVNITPFDADIIRGWDVIVDCLDSVEARRDLSQLCHQKKLPLVHGAVRNWYGQVGIESGENDLIRFLYPETTSPGPPKVMVMAVSLISAIQAAEACKLRLGHESPLTRSWLQCDLLHCDFDTIELAPAR